MVSGAIALFIPSGGTSVALPAFVVGSGGGSGYSNSNSSSSSSDSGESQGSGTKLETPKYDISKLQHEYKHTSDFGVKGNWNSANGEAFKNALNKHVSTSDTVLQSTYRGSDVIVYINSATANGAYYDLSGNFVGGWKFSAEQLQFHMQNGIPIK